MTTQTCLSEIKLNEKEIYHKQLYSNKFRNIFPGKIETPQTDPRTENLNNVITTEEDRNVTTPLFSHWAFPGGSVVKNPPAMQETWVQSLGGEDPLQKEMATHSSTLA